MKTLIIAPHVDDETIGCWSILNDAKRSVTVAWLYELTPKRRAEALSIHLVDEFVFGPILSEEFLKSFDEVYVPSRRDWHADHKEANALYRKWATHFYSVDMQNGEYLGDEQSSQKRQALNTWFPSQASLWETNAKYYLFEDIQKQDYDTYAVFALTGGVLSVPEEYRTETEVVLAKRSPGVPARVLFETVLQHIPSGKVRLDVGNTIYESEA